MHVHDIYVSSKSDIPYSLWFKIPFRHNTHYKTHVCTAKMYKNVRVSSSCQLTIYSAIYILSLLPYPHNCQTPRHPNKVLFKSSPPLRKHLLSAIIEWVLCLCIPTLTYLIVCEWIDVVRSKGLTWREQLALLPPTKCCGSNSKRVRVDILVRERRKLKKHGTCTLNG